MRGLRTHDGPNIGHGRFLWLNTVDGHAVRVTDRAPQGSSGGAIYHEGFPDIFAGLGFKDNGLYVLPSLDAVIVRLSEVNDEDFNKSDFLRLVLAGPHE